MLQTSATGNKKIERQKTCFVAKDFLGKSFWRKWNNNLTNNITTRMYWIRAQKEGLDAYYPLESRFVDIIVDATRMISNPYAFYPQFGPQIETSIEICRQSSWRHFQFQFLIIWLLFLVNFCLSDGRLLFSRACACYQEFRHLCWTLAFYKGMKICEQKLFRRIYYFRCRIENTELLIFVNFGSTKMFNKMIA